MRYVPAILVVAALACGVAGCGGGSGLPPGTTRVRFWHSMAGPLGKALRQVVEGFHKENPDVHVEPIFQGGYAQLSQKINLALLDGSPPELAQMYENMIAFCNRKEETILSLDDRIAADPELDFGDVFEPFRRTVLLGGRTFSLPPTKSFPVLYCNAALLKEAGLDRPPTTWDELAEVARRITRDLDGDGTPDRWGYAFVNDPWIFECMVLQEGGAFLKPDGTAALGGEPARKAMRWLLEATGQGRGPAFAYRTTGFDHQLDFAEGRVAMIIGSTVSRGFMEEQIDFGMWVAPIPQGPVKATVMAGPNVAIFAGVPEANRQAAWRFLRYMTRTEVTLYWAIATNYLPVRRSALEHPTYQRRLAADPGFGAGVAQLEYAQSEPPLPSWYECRQILNNTMQKCFQEPARMDALITEGVAEMDRVLAQERARDAGL